MPVYKAKLVSSLYTQHLYSIINYY